MDQTELPFDNSERQTISDFSRKAYLNYSMYVILDRALPNIADGLKPVQRRIIYAMSEIGLSAVSKPKKSARTVGDVLGKFHPHGDSACYEAMVLMAQDFSYRYPLIDGQGNWGSQDDPKSFAAMRYTESRLSRYAEILLNELKQGTVDWQPNFDGTLTEPVVLPAQAPNVLLNGSMGIAVGMSTDIPPHNLTEVINGALLLLKKPSAGIDELIKHIPAPDYPGGSEIITPFSERLKLYQTGQGSIKTRAVYHIEEDQIVITALPHQVSIAKIVEQIGQQMHQKKLPWVSDLRDESDHQNPVRIVIMLRSKRVDFESLMLHLFSSTDLEKNYRANLNIIGLDGRPAVKNLVTILTEWLVFRKNTTIKRLECRLDKILQRLHLLDGFLIAYLNIDEVIRIIRYEDQPKSQLIARFDLSDAQAEAILELKLRYLARLEEMKIRQEKQTLEQERAEIEKYLSDETALKQLMRKELTAVKKRHGDQRKSAIIQRKPAKALNESEIIPAEPVTIILSKLGWVRLAKSHEIDPVSLNYKNGDAYQTSATGRSNQPAVLFDSSGKAFTITTHSLPSARTQGEPITGRIKLENNHSIQHVIIPAQDEKILLNTEKGFGFIIEAKSLISKNRNGKHIVKLGSDDHLLKPLKVESIDNKLVIIITESGYMRMLPLNELPQLAKGRGNKLIKLAPQDKLKHVCITNPSDTLKINAGKRFLKLTSKDLESYNTKNTSKGKQLPKGFQKVQAVEVLLKP